MRSSLLLLALGASLASAATHGSTVRQQLHKRVASLNGRSKKGHTKTKTSSSSTPSSTSSGSAWSLEEDLSGDNFASAFTFVEGQSDNGGIANYLSQSDAEDAGLFYVTKNSSVFIGTDTTESAGNLRKAVKVTSNKQYNNFMMIVDVEHLPSACGAWPAIWSTGDDWPAGGEMDLVEYVNEQSLNSYSIHTGSGCTMSSSGSGFSAKYMMSDASEANVCNTATTDAQGCGTRSVKADSAGPGANDVGGGVYAMIQNSEGVTMYGFNRTTAPSDIFTDSPDPSNWDVTPDFFASSSSCPSSSFSAQTIVININLGGTWVSGVWDTDNTYADQAKSCQAMTGTSMEDYILNQGSGFSESYFLINTIKIFKQ